MLNFQTLILIFLNTIFVNSNYVHLIGYSIISNDIKTIREFNVINCAEACLEISNATINPCIGFRYLYPECTLLTMIRNIVENSTACSDYVWDKRNATSTLSVTDQLVYYNAYLNAYCPQATTDEVWRCLIAINEKTCLQYASFFEPVYNNSQCSLRPKRPNFYCNPNSKITSFWMYETPTYAYCYFKVTEPATPQANEPLTRCRRQSLSSTPISICNADENQFVRNNFFLKSYLMIGLHIPKTQPWNPTSFVWMGGNNCTYRNWASGEPNLNLQTGFDTGINVDKFVGMRADGRWDDVQKWDEPSLICKETSLTLKQYLNICESKDGCKEIQN